MISVIFNEAAVVPEYKLYSIDPVTSYVLGFL